MRCSCGLEFRLLNAPGKTIRACRRCDTTSHGGTLRFGPPNMPDTINGGFAATPEENK